MSDNICIDPRVVYPNETNTCEPFPRGTVDGTNAPRPQNSKAQASLQKTFTPQANPGLDSYRRNFIQGVFASSPSPSRTPAPTHQGIHQALTLALGPIGLSLGMLSGCGNGGSTNQTAGDAIPSTGDGGPADAGAPVDAGDGGGTPDAGDGGTGGGKNIPGTAVSHDSVPCGTDSSISDLDFNLGICQRFPTGPGDPANHQLFSWDSVSAGTAATLNTLSFPPDQMMESASGEIFITTHGDASAMPPQLSGLARVNASLPTAVEHETFPSLSLNTSQMSSSSRSISSIAPSFPKGLAQFGDQVFVATSNLDLNHGDYLPGTLLAYRTTTMNWDFIQTTDYNPTSVGILNGKLVVVNTGAVDFNGNATTASSIDIFNPASHELIKNIPLGQVAAGIEGEITASSDGNTLILPTGDNSGRLLVVRNLFTDTPSVQEITVATGAKVLLTGVALSKDEQYAYVGNFNDGKVYTLSLSGNKVVAEQSLDTDTSDFAGIGDSLSTGAALFMGVGNEILSMTFISK